MMMPRYLWTAVLATVAALLIVAAVSRFMPPPSRFSLVGCGTIGCFVFDHATGDLLLSPLPALPEAAPQKRKDNISWATF
jgi:hypothetical protein